MNINKIWHLANKCRRNQLLTKELSGMLDILKIALADQCQKKLEKK